MLLLFIQLFIRGEGNNCQFEFKLAIHTITIYSGWIILVILIIHTYKPFSVLFLKWQFSWDLIKLLFSSVYYMQVEHFDASTLLFFLCKLTLSKCNAANVYFIVHVS